VTPYIESRVIMDRLDAVAGIGNWQNRFEKGPDGGVICGISIRIDHEWVTKWDGAETPDEQEPGVSRLHSSSGAPRQSNAETGGQESGEKQKTDERSKNRIDAVKTSLTNAFKRAAVQWGTGRYLYGIAPQWAVFTDRGEYRTHIRGSVYTWGPPASLPLSSPKPERRNTARTVPSASSTGSETGSTATGTLRGEVIKRKYDRIRKQIWQNCLIVAGGDVEEAKKVLHRHAGIYHWERLFDSKAEQIYSAVEREAQEAAGL
jgi:hypothetical protein